MAKLNCEECGVQMSNVCTGSNGYLVSDKQLDNIEEFTEDDLYRGSEVWECYNCGTLYIFKDGVKHKYMQVGFGCKDLCKYVV